jgi:hypothetical protein
MLFCGKKGIKERNNGKKKLMEKQGAIYRHDGCIFSDTKVYPFR